MFLAAGQLVPFLRNDYIFAALLFLTRICLHAYFAVSYTQKALSPEGGPWVPTIYLVSTFPLHVWWMYNCVKGILKRRKQASGAQGAAPVAPATPAPTEAARMRNVQTFIRTSSHTLRTSTLDPCSPVIARRASDMARRQSIIRAAGAFVC